MVPPMTICPKCLDGSLSSELSSKGMMVAFVKIKNAVRVLYEVRVLLLRSKVVIHPIWVRIPFGLCVTCELIGETQSEVIATRGSC